VLLDAGQQYFPMDWKGMIGMLSCLYFDVPYM
jgi:hypothetical protein